MLQYPTIASTDLVDAMKTIIELFDRYDKEIQWLRSQGFEDVDHDIPIALFLHEFEWNWYLDLPSSYNDTYCYLLATLNEDGIRICKYLDDPVETITNYFEIEKDGEILKKIIDTPS